MTNLDSNPLQTKIVDSNKTQNIKDKGAIDE
jgi:hypothetical protein